MPHTDHPSHSIFLPSWWKYAFIIAVVGILAFLLWTIPNWGEFWRNVSQFPSLWQIPANRRIILTLIIKVAAPLLLMAIAGIILWIYFLLQSSLGEEAREDVIAQHVQPETRAEKQVYCSPPPSMREPPQQPQDGSFSTLPQLPFISPSYNPETPFPTTLSLTEALRRQAEESNNPPSLAKDEQPKENTSLENNLTVAPSFQPIVQGSEHNAASDLPLISLRLLKDVSIMINVPGGGHVAVPLTSNAKRVQLLAYIAWRRGELIDRDKILEHVFGWGLSDEEATEDKLSERFESHKKLLRKKIREVVIEHVNGPAGREIIDPDLDPFMSDSGFWGLSTICRVDDIEAIENNYRVISLAQKDGRLIDEIPEYVKEACEQLIASYPGDFLESLIKKYPSEFRPWQGRSSWTRKPYTQYRDYYLNALWHAAEYEWQMGQHSTENGNTEMEEANQHKQQEYFGRAAQKYQSYAMYACNSKFDSKATFGAHGEFGERVGMSERALRRCVVLLGAIGRTDLVNQVWSAYYTQMKSISDQRWQPSKETQADVQAARAQTSAYRFAAQVAQISSEFATRQGPTF